VAASRSLTRRPGPNGQNWTDTPSSLHIDAYRSVLSLAHLPPKGVSSVSIMRASALAATAARPVGEAFGCLLPCQAKAGSYAEHRRRGEPRDGFLHMRHRVG
jgi:hypothetical protein